MQRLEALAAFPGRAVEAAFAKDDIEGAGCGRAGGVSFKDVLDAATAASWTTVARAIMNTDEFITRE